MNSAMVKIRILVYRPIVVNSLHAVDQLGVDDDSVVDDSLFVVAFSCGRFVLGPCFVIKFQVSFLVLWPSC